MPEATDKYAVKSLFSTDERSAFDAISHAQFIAFAPYVFQASVLLRDKGLLARIGDAGDIGLTIEDVQEGSSLSHYAVRVLLEAGLGIGLVKRNDGIYKLTKTGQIFIGNRMTRVNTDFMRDVCYSGAQDLEAALTERRPAGLRHLGNWPTIYEGLLSLPEPAKTSWFEFDHFYSDSSFPEILPLVFKSPIAKLLDIGANTGKWALNCLGYDSKVHIGCVDLPPQIESARKNIEAAGFGNRASFYPQNMLHPDTVLPRGFDAIWMSQFLDCFNDEEILSILRKCHEALDDDGRVFINETFWDRQKFEPAAFSLQMVSLYFTTMANGNSQMYDSGVFLNLIDISGFKVTAITDNIAQSHTLVELSKK